jgi:hypothetical protein
MIWAAHQMRQIYADYNPGINPRDITVDEIRFFYMPMIDGLCRMQKELAKRKGNG